MLFHEVRRVKKFRDRVVDRFEKEFGNAARATKKLVAWHLSDDRSVAVQIDLPVGADSAMVWLPYPPNRALLPQNAQVYEAGVGRHSNTYPSPGLDRGKRVLKVTITTDSELNNLVGYINASRSPRSV
jgi:hypothetical protein